MQRVQLDAGKIQDWDSFHAEFARALGFPDFYGANMNAWIDCMSYVDDPQAGMTSIHVDKDEPFLLEIMQSEGFMHRCPEQFTALVECCVVVNQRFIESESQCVLALVLL